jgi:hypothetical protein
MKLVKSMVVAGVLCAAAAGCESNPKYKEDMLSSAGFKPAPPKTAALVASMKSLTPHKLTRTTYKGKTVWVYSDPTICGCVYIGNQGAFDAYMQAQRRRTDLDMTTMVDPNQNIAWDVSPWAEVYGEP